MISQSPRRQAQADGDLRGGYRLLVGEEAQRQQRDRDERVLRYGAVAASNVDANNAMQLLNAKERGENGDSNVFVYYFSHVMPGPEAMGAFHTAEVPYFINHFSEARAEFWTDVDLALGDARATIW